MAYSLDMKTDSYGLVRERRQKLLSLFFTQLGLEPSQCLADPDPSFDDDVHYC